MTTTVPQTVSLPHQPRRSTSTTRRPLLAPSETASLISQPYTEGDGDGEATPRAHSPVPTLERRSTLAAPSPQQNIPYKGFPSEAAYLAFLHAWAEEKKHVRYDTGLKGFYGERTVEEYASRPGVSLGLREKWRARRKGKSGEGDSAGERGRRKTVA